MTIPGGEASRDIPYVRVPAEQLLRTVSELLQLQGVPIDDAREVARVLVAADLRGIESHGIARLASYYLDGLANGGINPRPQRSIVRDAGSLFLLEADNGLGHPACTQATDECLRRARQHGVSVGLVRGSNHFGIAGYYAMRAAEAGFIGMCLTNSRPLVLPTFSRQATLGTNPIAFAVPAAPGRQPFVLDMATSTVAMGRIEVHHRRGEEIPLGWGADADGRATRDPAQVLAGGGLFPLGGTAATAGYKGYGLAAMVDILSGVLSGANFLTGVLYGAHLEPADVGHFVMALDVAAVMEPDDFHARMDEFLEQLRGAPQAAGCDGVLVAGDPEHAATELNRRKGVPLHPGVYQVLLGRAADCGITPPVPLSDDEGTDLR